MSELDELAQEAMRKVACPEPMPDLLPRKHPPSCQCIGTGEILDPQLANLREVLLVECEGCKQYSWMPENREHLSQCAGYIRRKWGGPDWWLDSLIDLAAGKDRIWGGKSFLGTDNITTAVIAALKAKA